nr:MAG: major capsid protein [Microvirus sp.]
MVTKLKSVMDHQFSQVPKAEIQRSSFDRSSGHKTTINAGFLYPVFLDEALPGDTFSLSPTFFARMATPIYPLMDNLFLDHFWFEVPYRLVWDNWKKFNGEQKNPGDSTDFLIPQMVAPTGGHLEGSLSDYMGIPTKIEDLSHSTLWHRAYALIYNEWFRDQNLIDSTFVNTNDGPDTDTDYPIQRRGKRHDYFTSALPTPQKGPSVSIPLGNKAFIAHDAADTANIGAYSSVNSQANTLTTNLTDLAAGTVAIPVTGQLYADLNTATASTINQLRQSFAIQKLLERDMRGGTRYTETIRAHFQVSSPDQRQQRPIYLGGGSTGVNFNQVPSTVPTAIGTTPQASLAAYATAGSSSGGFTASFTEHSLIIGLVSIRADLTYQQGLNRMFSRKTRFDHYWPSLAHIGEQTLLQKEIFSSGIPAEDDTVFGYQERFAEMRYKPSIITGAFRSNAATPLDAWHLSQNFATAPVLGKTFIEETPPMERVEAVPSEPDFILDMHFQLRCARPMPLYGVPGFIDRF